MNGMQPVQGEVLAGRYCLLRPLGKGGMAEVYRARDLRLERTVAVKILRPEFSQYPDFRERFRQEAKASANLTHPNLVTVYDFGYDGDRLFIVMEYVPGGTLADRIRQQAPLSVEETLRLMVQACAGVGYAHRAGLVHCDIKPHNMLVTPDGRLKVTDFGIARAWASIRAGEQANIVWGSPQYFSPEQAAGKPPLPASDVYSLGVILYEMLTGRLPFLSDDPLELARLHREAEPIPPRRFNPAIPYRLEQVMLKVLAKEPAARYRTADQLGRILLTFLEEDERDRTERVMPTPRPVTTPRPRAASRPTQVNRRTLTPGPAPDPPAAPAEEPDPLDVDWVTVGLALVAVLAVGGLIPFWLYIYFLYHPPVR